MGVAMITTLDAAQCRNFDLSSRREWILTNGIGGFAMGTVSGSNQRRYHGLLVAAEPAPAHRMVLLGNIEAFVQADGNPIGLSCNQYQGAINPEGHQYIDKFIATSEFVQWTFKALGVAIEKTVLIHKGENAVTIRYKNIGTKGIGLSLRPLVQHKFYHENFRQSDDYPHTQVFPRDRTIIEHQGQSLILFHPGAVRLPTVGWYFRFEHQREIERGLDARDDQFCPCELKYELLPGEEAVVVASLGDESPPQEITKMPGKASGMAEVLRQACDRFIVETPERSSIIAGYPWFTDWGRDTMISIPGICLHNGQIELAKKILRDYASQMNQGLIPNRFVDCGDEPEYNTVDATLWFAQAIYRTLQTEWDAKFAKECMGYLKSIYEWHMKGTHYGIHVDPKDGLLTQGQEGVQLTWMDAKLGDWVVTPRHGKPVEINGLWISALRILEWLADELKIDGSAFKASAELAESNFEKKFWKESLGYYMDTVDPDDASLRPNQLIAMAVPFAPANGKNAVRAFAEVSRELLTPVGIRTLAPSSSQYKPQFKGPMSELDAAYHQGTVWPWLMGPYITAMVKLTGDRIGAKRILKNGKELLNEYGIGGVAEVYDGDEPRTPGGCPWQAWSAAEWLRAWIEDAQGK